MQIDSRLFKVAVKPDSDAFIAGIFFDSFALNTQCIENDAIWLHFDLADFLCHPDEVVNRILKTPEEIYISRGSRLRRFPDNEHEGAFKYYCLAVLRFAESIE